MVGPYGLFHYSILVPAMFLSLVAKSQLSAVSSCLVHLSNIVYHWRITSNYVWLPCFLTMIYHPVIHISRASCIGLFYLAVISYICIYFIWSNCMNKLFESPLYEWSTGLTWRQGVLCPFSAVWFTGCSIWK